MGSTSVVWSGICNTGRMLGIIRLCERDMDTRSHNQLESDIVIELYLHGNRVRSERCVPGQESVAGGQCHGCEDQ